MNISYVQDDLTYVLYSQMNADYAQMKQSRD